MNKRTTQCGGESLDARQYRSLCISIGDAEIVLSIGHRVYSEVIQLICTCITVLRLNSLNLKGFYLSYIENLFSFLASDK